MIEQIKAVNNPLTIIAIFAGLAEVASIFALRYVNPELQYIFLWFVMCFPVLLVVLFFLTLNFNPKVLYAPSDFKDDESFLQTLNVNRVAVNLDEIQNQLESAKTEIVKYAIEEITNVGNLESKKISEIVNFQLNPVETSIEQVKYAVDNLSSVGLDEILLKVREDFILSEIGKHQEGVTINQLQEALRLNKVILYRILSDLETAGKIRRDKSKDPRLNYYFLAEK